MSENRKLHGRATGRLACAFTALVIASAGMFVPHSADSQEAAGNLAAAIRESGNPCVHVVEAEQTGNNSYKVRCNSGTFHVTINDDGSAQVSAAD